MRQELPRRCGGAGGRAGETHGEDAGVSKRHVAEAEELGQPAIKQGPDNVVDSLHSWPVCGLSLGKRLPAVLLCPEMQSPLQQLPTSHPDSVGAQRLAI